MLAEKGIFWKDYPEFFKSGTYAKRTPIELPLTEEMKKFASNSNKETFTRMDIQNFYHPRLSRETVPFEEILFSHVFQNAEIKKQNKMK